MTTDISAPVQTLQRRVRFRSGVWTESVAGGKLWLLSRGRGVSLGRPDPTYEAVLAKLAEPGGADEDELPEVAMAVGGFKGLMAAEGLMNLLRDGGWLATSLALGTRELLTLHPGAAVPPRPRSAPVAGGPDGSGSAAGLPAAEPDEDDLHNLVLSRFAVIRRDGPSMILESPGTSSRVDITDPAVLALLSPGSERGVLPSFAVTEVLRLLARHGFLVADPAEESDELASAQWSPHELWFHSRTRLGGHDEPYGGTYWAKGRFEPLPSRHPRFADQPSIPLFKPDLDALRHNDMPLTEVLETRRSIRSHDADAPLTIAQLGEFLYRTARSRGIVHDGTEELSNRPYPAGGSLHELELYPVVTNVDGLAPGLYHYDGHEHRLETVAADSPAVRKLATTAARMSLMDSSPQVVIVVAARFGRLMWKYQTIGYALVLKHTGVLYQTMYSVATAMGLGPCGLGGGDVYEFAEASGLDLLEESSVGEFVLGSIGSAGVQTGSAAAAVPDPSGEH